MFPEAEDNFVVKRLIGGPTYLAHLRHKITYDELEKAINLEKGQFAIMASGQDACVCATDPTSAFGFSLLGIKLMPQLSGGTIAVCSKGRIKLSSLDGFLASPGAGLDRLLAELSSFLNSINGKVAVAFSGGLDSSLISWLLRKRDPLLITVGSENSADVTRAIKSAKVLGLNHIIVHLDQISSAIGAVSEFSKTIMDYSLAAGFFLASRKAAEMGAEWLVTGQLADELFGGYSRYRKLSESDINSVLLSDFLNANVQRDALAILYGGTTPVFAYASRPFANLALGLPSNYKIDKIGLRTIASMAGMPDELLNSKKKAFQYGSGIQKAVFSKLNG